MQRILKVLTVIGSVPAGAADTAAGFPNKSIRLIVPFPAGGGTDIVARAISVKLTEAWGQQIIIDNRGGAGGRTRAVNRAPACGM